MNRADAVPVADWSVEIPDDDHVRFFKNTNWAASPFGRLETWSNSLQIYTHQLLSDSRPACIYWGPGKAAIYNAGFVPLAGKTHPTLMGANFKVCFEEIWENIKPVFDAVESTRKAVDVVELPLMVERSGFLEETYFTGNFLPLRDDNGRIEGVYNSLVEVTKQKLADRRNDMLTPISLAPHECTSQTIRTHIMKCLESNVIDIPFAMLYQTDANHVYAESSLPGQLNLRGSIGVPNDHPLLVQHGHIDSIAGVFPLLKQTNFLDPVTTSPGKEFEGVDWQGHAEPSKHLVVMPLATPSRLSGYLIIGTNPRRPLDVDHDRFIHDVTAKVSSVISFAYDNEKLVMSEKTVRYMAAHLDVALEHLNLDGQVLWANKKYYDLIHDQPKSEFFSKRLPFIDHVHEEDQPMTREAWKSCITGVKIHVLEIRMKRMYRPPVGLSVHATVLLSAFPHVEGNQIVSVMASMTDVSRLKWAEAWQARAAQDAQEAKRLQSEFTDALSHEVRNPLSAIMQLGDSISSSLDEYGDQGPTTVELCMQALQQNIEAAKTILTCARHQKRIAGFHVHEAIPNSVQPPDLLDGALRILGPDLLSADINLIVKRHDSIKDLTVDWILCDTLRVVQISLNLLSNAVKFTRHENHRQITVEYGCALTNPKALFSEDILWVPPKQDIQDITLDDEWSHGEQLYLTFRVTDTGPGMTSEECRHLFNKFQQANPETSTRYGGTGLGLFISQVLVEKHGGSIGLSSTYGQGSTFAFYVKVRRTEAPAGTPAISIKDLRLEEARIDLAEPPIVVTTLKTPINEKQKQPYKYHVMLVEDNIVNQRILQKQLSKAGCVVTVANHGLEALELIQLTNLWADNPSGTHLDVVLLDMQMPIMDGLTCCREIRLLEKSGQLNAHIEVIAVTANVRHEQIERAIAAGVDGVMPKPFLVSDLLSTIKQRLQR